MTSISRLEIMIHHPPSIICDFHCSIDFWLDILFPHIFWFLHQNWVQTSWFTLTKHRSVGDEEKTIPSCLDTSSLMNAPPVLLQSAFCALKQTDFLKLGCFKFLVLDIFNARRVSAELQLENQTDGVVLNLTKHFRSAFGTGCSTVTGPGYVLTLFQTYTDIMILVYLIWPSLSRSYHGIWSPQGTKVTQQWPSPPWLQQHLQLEIGGLLIFQQYIIIVSIYY